MTAAEAGRWGEELAAQHYRERGYSILTRNYRVRSGEIDLIAQKQDTLVFVEVKTREENALGRPAEWVTAAKRQKILSAAMSYLQQRGTDEFHIRFDVAEVIRKESVLQAINIIENAFTA